MRFLHIDNIRDLIIDLEDIGKSIQECGNMVGGSIKGASFLRKKLREITDSFNCLAIKSFREQNNMREPFFDSEKKSKKKIKKRKKIYNKTLYTQESIFQ